MEIKKAERVIVAKPVASRPTSSKFGSFSDLLESAIDSSPPDACPQPAMAAIKPKTVRFKPMVNPAPASAGSSQVEFSGTAVSSDKSPPPDNKPTVVYKPQAKLVSKTTVSVLANMGNFDTHQQHPFETQTWYPNCNKPNFTSHIVSNLHQNVHEADQMTLPSRLTSQNMEEDPKALLSAANVDRPSYDGYNWRKYGQKQVKGSEYPRSYYKCTHPNCPVKKKVERSLDGQIAEIVYKGEHNHVKPQPPKRNSLGTQALPGLGTEGIDQDANTTIWSNRLNENSDNKVENQKEIGLTAYSTYQGKPPLMTAPTNAGIATPDSSCGLRTEQDDGSRGIEGEGDEPRSKKRKNENQAIEIGTSGEGLQEPQVAAAEPEILGDGFRWRKYGQKVVKGNPYPRSYYRCTSQKCNVRKHVERSLNDPNAFITTYEGKHNHEMPLRSTNAAATESDSQVPTSGRDKG